ncbi:sugar ABC transporter ATP-binding protein [Rhizobium sp. KVB221]|uniref:Sugar ABC transporter ATP-binding protein n=1 Tax=Rhizobium setariae TaxID=2801340 RepID=A0A936YP90_9HYPH|nr:sugar ABC transporter ATP-binding protein [Rhizobium setariae]MBL0374264.1 sugar ABC transporter ATP-binding protein [Rhizobium setariae]
MLADTATLTRADDRSGKPRQPVLLAAEGLQKSYGPVQAVKELNLYLHAGEALALCGENGAGKSTIFKILAGEVIPDAGRMTVGGTEYRPVTASQAVASGVSMVHQEFNILPNISVAENMFLGRMEEFSRFGKVDWHKLYAAATALLKRLGINADPRAEMRRLSPSTQKMIELARALSTNPKVLLLDEITASLDHDDAETLHRLMDELRAQGVGIIYVSHRLQEIFRSCTTIEIMKDGAWVATRPASELDEDQLSALMVGRDLADWKRPARHVSSSQMLEVKGLSGPGFSDVSLSVRKGQIVTLAGLAGSGADEILEALFGARAVTSGEILLEGKAFSGTSIAEAIAAGIAMVPKERAVEGLIDTQPIRFNIGLAGLPKNARGPLVDGGREAAQANLGMDMFRIKARSSADLVRSLSGGNKQKVLLAKWFLTDPRLMLLNNPTRGVDIGVKFEIYDLMLKLSAEKNLAILLASEDMAEVIRLSDTVITIRHGRASGVFEGDAITETNLINAML